MKKSSAKRMAAIFSAIVLTTGLMVTAVPQSYAADRTTTLGDGATAAKDESTAVGYQATATEANSVVLGGNSRATADWTTVLGGQSWAKGHADIAIGPHTVTNGRASVAIGDSVIADHDYAIGIGSGVKAQGDNSIAVGDGSSTKVANAVVLGSKATATNANSVALGANSTTGAANTGDTAKQVTFDSTTTTFAGPATTANGTVSVGKKGAERQIQNVAAGDISSTSTDAVNGSQLNATNEQVKKNITNIKTNAANIQTNATNISNLTDTVNAGWEADVNGIKVKSVTPSSNKLNYVAGKNMTITGSGDDITIATKDDVAFNSVKVGNTVNISSNGIDAGNTKITNVQDGTVSPDSKDAVNGSQLYSVEQDVLNMGDSINNIGGRVNDLDKRVDKVGAGAAALAALHPLDFDPDDKWDFAAGYGHYDGRNAYALGLFYRPNEDTMFSAGSTLGNGENLFNAGLSLKIGQGNHVSTTRVAMAKEMLDLRADNKAMHEQINTMNDRLNTVLGMLDMAKSASFPDVPENHWAYEAVSKLAGNGIIKGYPDGTFQGDRAMTRYEFASMLYRAMQNGDTVDGRLLKEFKPELDLIRVDAVSKHIDRVRVNHK